VSSGDLHVVVPGSLSQRTGGYLYDARMVAGLRELGWDVVVHELEGSFPDPDGQARASLESALESIAAGGRVLVDGLAMGGLPGPLRTHRDRLQILSIVHHPLSDETGLDDDQRERFRSSEQEALRACVGVLVTSRFTASRVRAYGLPSNRVHSVSPGVDRAQPAQGQPEGAAPQLLRVASITPRKGQDVLVRALGRVRALSWRCVCAGSLDRVPEYAEMVRHLAQESGVGERVEFVGECDDEKLNALYDESSIFVLPSHFEGYGMVLTEALARGLPIVSTTAGAIPDTVPPAAGVLVAPGDDAALAEALGTLLRTPSRLEGLALAARSHARDLPSWKHAVSAFAEAILDLTPDPPITPNARDLSLSDVS
jgi:glycosyltransferase involved in cell wall biosynthesis